MRADIHAMAEQRLTSAPCRLQRAEIKGKNQRLILTNTKNQLKSMYDQLDNLNITIDKSVKSITRAACMYLSLAIEYGILLTENPTARIVIYDDHIDFGVSMNPMMDMINGALLPHFYKENTRVVYRFIGDAKCEVNDQVIDYVGNDCIEANEESQVFQQMYTKYGIN